MGVVVSLTTQLSAGGATSGVNDPAGRAGIAAISRESFSRHSRRSAGGSSEHARSFSIASLAPCASAPALARPTEKATQIVAILIVSRAACAPGGPAIPEPPGSGWGRALLRGD